MILTGAAQEVPLLNTVSIVNLTSDMQSTGIFVVFLKRYFRPGKGIRLFHTEKSYSVLMIKKTKIARETTDFEAKTDESHKKTDRGRSYLGIEHVQ